MVVHPGVGNRYDTLVNALLWHLGHRQTLEDNKNDSSQEDNEDAVFQSTSVFVNDKPSAGLVHRIDKDTSGLIIVAKYSKIHAELQLQFKDRTVSREYHTLCWGNFSEEHFLIESNIDRDPRNRQRYSVSEITGKHALTEVWVKESFGIASYLKIKLHTGRTHQIRVHLSSRNRPIIADEMYGGMTQIPNKHYPKHRRLANEIFALADRQLLHAKKITFFHPRIKQQMEFEVDMPKDISAVLGILRNYDTKTN